jgi:hypothetical protein
VSSSAAPAQTEREVVTALETVQTGIVAQMVRAEIDSQISTAKAFPRSLTKFYEEVREMACLTEEVAAGCIYALPRDGKTIEGPTARLAEIVASAWGNCRAAARVIDEGSEFVTAQGIFHDLERNVQISFEVKRRIINSYGKRYSTDMIAVTGNAAASIALRNAVFKGVPKAFWQQAYNEARKLVAGDVKSLAQKRHDAMVYLLKFGVTEERVFAALNVAGVEDIGLEELVVLRGAVTAIRDGDTTPEESFPPVKGTNQKRARSGGMVELEQAATGAVNDAIEESASGAVDPVALHTEAAPTTPEDEPVQTDAQLWKRLNKAVLRARKLWNQKRFLQEVPKGEGKHFYTDEVGLQAIGNNGALLVYKGDALACDAGIVRVLAEDLEARCEAQGTERTK